jgi:hypothetical protein
MLPSDQIARKEYLSIFSIFEANRSAEFDILERELTQTNENTSQPYKLRREARHWNPIENTFLECAWDSRSNIALAVVEQLHANVSFGSEVRIFATTLPEFLER